MLIFIARPAGDHRQNLSPQNSVAGERATTGGGRGGVTVEPSSFVELTDQEARTIGRRRRAEPIFRVLSVGKSWLRGRTMPGAAKPHRPVADLCRAARIADANVANRSAAGLEDPVHVRLFAQRRRASWCVDPGVSCCKADFADRARQAPGASSLPDDAGRYSSPHGGSAADVGWLANGRGVDRRSVCVYSPGVQPGNGRTAAGSIDGGNSSRLCRAGVGAWLLPRRRHPKLVEPPKLRPRRCALLRSPQRPRHCRVDFGARARLPTRGPLHALGGKSPADLHHLCGQQLPPPWPSATS